MDASASMTEPLKDLAKRHNVFLSIRKKLATLTDDVGDSESKQLFRDFLGIVKEPSSKPVFQGLDKKKPVNLTKEQVAQISAMLRKPDVGSKAYYATSVRVNGIHCRENDDVFFDPSVRQLHDQQGVEDRKQPRQEVWIGRVYSIIVVQVAGGEVPMVNFVWFWKTSNQDTLKSVEQLMEMYEQSVGHGAVLLLNHTPDRTGRIPELDARRAAEFGAEIRRRYGVALADTSGKGRVLELQPSAPVRIDRIVTMEDIALGERVRKYVIEARIEGQWRELCSGTAIGHKKIDRVAPVTVSRLRWRCLESVGEPALRRLAIYDTAVR
jgi:hypothetical protein